MASASVLRKGCTRPRKVPVITHERVDGSFVSFGGTLLTKKKVDCCWPCWMRWRWTTTSLGNFEGGSASECSTCDAVSSTSDAQRHLDYNSIPSGKTEAGKHHMPEGMLQRTMKVGRCVETILHHLGAWRRVQRKGRMMKQGWRAPTKKKKKNGFGNARKIPFHGKTDDNCPSSSLKDESITR